MQRKQTGFTLVEIAIVLVIIGLLLGGVLKGQQLIENARVKNILNDMRGVSAAHYAYFDRFKAFAGDDAQAVAHLGAAAFAGNGNGTINGTTPFNAATLNCAGGQADQILFWGHLRRSNLLAGAATDCSSPVHSDGGLLGVQTGNGAGGNALVSAGNGIPGLMICANGIQDSHAQQIDTNIDDGVGTTGTSRIGVNGTTIPAAAAAYTPATPSTLRVFCFSI